jgi:tetratricopeptide (TPR) repeat protein
MKLISWCFCFSLFIQLWLFPLPVWAGEIEKVENAKLFDLAARHAQTGNYQQAIVEFTTVINTVISKDQTKSSAYLNRCFAYLQLEDYLESLADCSQVIQLQPQTQDAYLHRGLANYRLGRYPQALIDYDRLITLNSQNFRAYYNRGLAKLGMENYLEAIADYNHALDNIPPEDGRKIATVYNDRGLAYFLQGDLNQAKADFNHAIALDRRAARSYYNLACIYHHQDSFQKAIANFTTTLELDPNQPDAYKSRGLSYQKLGNTDLALADLYQAAKIYRLQGQVAAYQTTMQMIEAIDQERSQQMVIS